MRTAVERPTPAGRLIINEAATHGCATRNEYGERADLVELHNPGGAFELEPGTWFLSDAPADPMRYELPTGHVDPHGYLVIWCDAAATDADQPHAGFKLHDGERLALWHLTGDALCLADSVTLLPRTPKGCTQGRSPVGPARWCILAQPTPGRANDPGLPE